MIADNRLPGFRADIEGMRGIAILIVVLFHCGLPGVSGGFVGVDVFFVLSGFLITGLLVREIQNTSKLSLLQFYARRARRLLPASALTLVVSLFVGAMILAPHELDNAGHAGRAAALYVSNIFFDHNAGDYFAADVKTNPMLHTWSLAVEEQYYLFWPLLISLSLLRWKSMKVLVIMLSGLTVLSLAIGVWSTTNRGTFAFYELPARAWEFGMGALTVVLPRGMLRMPRGWWLAFGWIGILAILGSTHFIAGEIGFPGWVAFVPVMGTVMALLAGTEYPQHGVGVMLSSKPLQVLGTLSYSWYLWHWPFLVFAAALLPDISIAGKIVVAAASLVIAGISYHFVEHPIRFHPSLIKRPALSVGLAAVVTLCSLGAALLAMRFAGHLSNEPEMQMITAAINDITRLPRQECVSALQFSDVKVCDFGNTSSGVNIVLFGDSHAIQWFNPLEQIAKSNGWRLTTIVKSACPSLDIQPLRQRDENLAAACSKWRAEALRRIIALHPTIVFIANSTSRLGNRSTYIGDRDITESAMIFALDQLQDGTRRTLQALRGTRVVLMRDTPYFSYDIPTCLARSIRHIWHPGGSCEADRSIVLNAAVFESEQAGATGLSNVHFIDVTDRICEREICRPIQRDAPIYRDHHHLTGAFADSLMAALNTQLIAIVRAPVDVARVSDKGL
jgi:peptidoglycan/LPS O-acetylase OafA/YrhL